MKFWSFVSSSSFFVKVTLISRRSAPGAAKFVNPDALSFSDGSSSALIKFSWTSNPIRYDGSSSYWSNIKVWFWTWTKVPRTNIHLLQLTSQIQSHSHQLLKYLQMVRLQRLRLNHKQYLYLRLSFLHH